MPVDQALVKFVLEDLRNADGHPLEEGTLGSMVELRANRPLTSRAIKDAVMFCRQKGWADCMTDDFGQDRWVITDVGRAKRL